MKGTITKLDNQWMVRYDTFQNDHSYPLPAYNFLPLHPEYQTILPLNLDLEGGEVEFKAVEEPQYKIYAKLIQPKEKISDEEIDNNIVKEYENVGDEKLFPNFTDKDIWMDGFYDGAKWYREQLKQKQ